MYSPMVSSERNASGELQTQRAEQSAWGQGSAPRPRTRRISVEICRPALLPTSLGSPTAPHTNQPAQSTGSSLPGRHQLPVRSRGQDKQSSVSLAPNTQGHPSPAAQASHIGRFSCPVVTFPQTDHTAKKEKQMKGNQLITGEVGEKGTVDRVGSRQSRRWTDQAVDRVRPPGWEEPCTNSAARLPESVPNLTGSGHVTLGELSHL